jgi:hypothetical protein
MGGEGASRGGAWGTRGRWRRCCRPGPARPDTNYWHEHVAGRAAVYFLKGRIRFGSGGQSAPYQSALVDWEADPSLLASLDAALLGAWRAG